MAFKLTVLVLALVGSAYSILLNHLKYRSSSNPTPKSVADVYDEKTYQSWRAYNAEHCRLEYVFAGLSLLVTLVMLACNAYSAFASLFSTGAQFFAVVLLETLVGFVLGSVKSYVSTMVIEEKYGFNRSKFKTFVADRIRSLLLEFVLSFCLASLLMLLHGAMGDGMILLFALVIFCITMLSAFLYPLFSRIGNKFVPLEEGELRDRLMELLTKHGYKVKAIEVMDASRRTTKLNAYFTGFGKMKTIVLFDNLVNAMSTEEICAVFAHELGHGIHKDIPKRQLLNLGNLLLMAVVAWISVKLPALHAAFGFEGINYGFAIILTGIGLGVLQPLSMIAMNASGRAAEYRADAQAVCEGYGEEMITALKKLARENFADLSPLPATVILEYSHPPIAQRVEAIQKALSKQAQ